MPTSLAPQSIRFDIQESSLGPILVACSPRGLVAVLMDDNSDTLRLDLGQRFPGIPSIEESPSSGSPTTLHKLALRVLELIESPWRKADFPTDAHGTEFQHAVWQELRKIPSGTTATYTQIATAIGHPRSVRAVAQACAANPLAVIVPCHRVVRSDGKPSGYRWGLKRKTALVERERANPI